MPFEYDLTTKQKFYLYLSIILPDLDIIQRLWVTYRRHEDNINLQFYQTISPFRPHPCGDASILEKIAGIDPDMYSIYMYPREHYLASIRMIGHSDFICQIKRKKAEIEDNVNYFDAILNEERGMKLPPLHKLRILDRVIMYLLTDAQGFEGEIDHIMQYLIAFYHMYRDTKILHAYPLAIDREGVLLRFE